MPYQWKGLRNYESRSSPYLTNNKFIKGGYATHWYAGPIKGTRPKMLPRAQLTIKY